MLRTKKEVTKIFLTNRISSTLIIPIELARKHGLNKPSYVVVEEIPDGILIRKLRLENDNDVHVMAGEETKRKNKEAIATNVC